MTFPGLWRCSNDSQCEGSLVCGAYGTCRDRCEGENSCCSTEGPSAYDVNIILNVCPTSCPHSATCPLHHHKWGTSYLDFLQPRTLPGSAWRGRATATRTSSAMGCSSAAPTTAPGEEEMTAAGRLRSDFVNVICVYA